METLCPQTRKYKMDQFRSKIIKIGRSTFQMSENPTDSCRRPASLLACKFSAPQTLSSQILAALAAKYSRKYQNKAKLSSRDEDGCLRSLPEDQNPGIQGSLAVSVARQLSRRPFAPLDSWICVFGEAALAADLIMA